jgi:hypothetical protein
MRINEFVEEDEDKEIYSCVPLQLSESFVDWLCVVIVVVVVVISHHCRT